MKIFDLLRLCLDNLRRRKGRTVLTVVGVMVGTCSILLMVSLGVAINKAQEDMLQSWGDLTQIEIMNYSYNSSSELPTLDDKIISEIRAMDHVITATPMYQSDILSCQIFAGKKDKYSTYGWNIYGVYPDSIEALGYQLVDGTYLPTEATGNKKIPVLVGQYTAYDFEDTTKSYRSNKRRVDRYATDVNGNPADPFFDISKETLTLRTDKQEENAKQYSVELTVTGVMLEDYSKGWYTSEGIIMDINQLKKIEQEYKKLNNIKDTNSSSNNGYQEVYVKVDDVKNVAAVEEKIKEYGYNTYSMSSQREEMQKQSAVMQMILGGIGATALVVAAIGIANTMTMAIYERTREIGIMKVLGCRLSEIRKMFLIESACIGLMGGIVGVLVSYGASALLNYFAPIIGEAIGMSGVSKISIIPIWLLLLGLSFSTLIGLISGLIPANKAVKISALEAIRRE